MKRIIGLLLVLAVGVVWLSPERTDIMGYTVAPGPRIERKKPWEQYPLVSLSDATGIPMCGTGNGATCITSFGTATTTSIQCLPSVSTASTSAIVAPAGQCMEISGMGAAR